MAKLKTVVWAFKATDTLEAAALFPDDLQEGLEADLTAAWHWGIIMAKVDYG